MQKFKVVTGDEMLVGAAGQGLKPCVKMRIHPLKHVYQGKRAKTFPISFMSEILAFFLLANPNLPPTEKARFTLIKLSTDFSQ